VSAPILRAEPETIARAAALLRDGRLVGFPTQIVYGLGGDATNEYAVAAIFAAKGRPRFNPLIVHVPGLAEAEALAVFDARAHTLAAHFRPGPLSLVLARRNDSGLSLLASAGLDTVAIRAPSHPIAQALLRVAGRPVAAPPANRSGRVSSTSRSATTTPSSPVACGCLSAAMARRNVSSAFATSRLVAWKRRSSPFLRLAEQRPDVLLKHGERRMREPVFRVGGLRDQDRDAARRREIGKVLHRHHRGFRKQPTETGGVDSLDACGIPPSAARWPRASSPAENPPRLRARTTSASQLCHGSSPSTGWPAHTSWAIPKSERSRGARDANLEKAALKNCLQHLNEGRRPRSVAGQARDGKFPGGDRRTPQ
jgi:tRNA threonylcarbamoyl adenosine modification protein (Sua5/YciO/YrdC/YwlC family)